MEEGFSLTKAVNLKDLPESLQQDLMDVNTEDELHLDLRSYFDDEEAFADFLDTDKLTVQDLGETISLTVQSIYEFEQATLDESIYQEIFPDKTINDEEGFKEALREALESSYERDADGHLFKEVKDTFIKNYNKGLPEEFLKRWFEKVQSEDEESENDDEKTEEERYEDFVNDIKWMVVVDGLADRYDISVENQEVMEYAQAMIRNEVSRIGMGEIGEDKVKEYAANYLQDQNNFYKSLFTLKEDKVFRKLKEEVTFQEEHLTYNEFHELTNQDQATETEKATNNEQSA
jgi:trigger factor